MARTEYTDIRRKIVLEHLEKFRDTPSKTLARIIYRDYSKLFKDIEDARWVIRTFRGKSGKKNREGYKLTKYYTNVQPT